MTPELTALLIAAMAGAVVAWRLDRAATGSLLGGEALLFGVGAMAMVPFALALAHLPWTRPACLLGMLLVALIARMIPLRGRGEPTRVAAQPRERALAAALLAFAALLVIGYAIFATIAPMWEFDFIADWGFKARAFFAAHTIDWTFLDDPLHRDTHPDYPLLLPLAFDALAIARGAWNDQAMGLISVVCAAALLLVVHRLALEELRSHAGAALLTAAMVPFACSPWIGLADGPLVAYGTAALLLIRRGSMVPGAVLLGLAAFTKNEGLTLIVAAAAGLAVARRGRDIARLWPAVVIAAPWLVLRRIHHLQTDLAEGNFVARIVDHLRDPRPLVDAFASYNVGKPLLWIALLAGVLLALRPLLARERFALVAVAVQFLFYVGAYLATPHDVDWHVRWSWERLLSHLTPLLGYVVLARLVAPPLDQPR